MAESPAVDLEFATVDQIVDELERRFGNVLMALDAERQHGGIMFLRRGDSTMALGMHAELGMFLAQRWHESPTREREET